VDRCRMRKLKTYHRVRPRHSIKSLMCRGEMETLDHLCPPMKKRCPTTKCKMMRCAIAKRERKLIVTVRARPPMVGRLGEVRVPEGNTPHRGGSVLCPSSRTRASKYRRLLSNEDNVVGVIMRALLYRPTCTETRDRGWTTPARGQDPGPGTRAPGRSDGLDFCIVY
jgi:hypothetical protein